MLSSPPPTTKPHVSQTSKDFCEALLPGSKLLQMKKEGLPHPKKSIYILHNELRGYEGPSTQHWPVVSATTGHTTMHPEKLVSLESCHKRGAVFWGSFTTEVFIPEFIEEFYPTVVVIPFRNFHIKAKKNATFPPPLGRVRVT